jgi:hypothetical protein
MRINSIENLRYELSVPIRSFRLMAIEKSIKMKASEDLLDCLIGALGNEKDPECKMLLRHAILITKTSLETKDSIKLSFGTFKETYLKGNADIQIQAIEQLSLKSLKGKSFSDFFTWIIRNAASPLVTGKAIKRLRNKFKPENIEYLEDNIFSQSKFLQLSIIELLAKNYPDIIQKHFCEIILINDPKIKAIAIRALSKNFAAAALAYISDCFEKGDLYNKLAGLQACTTIDFNLTKPILFKLISEENESRILEEAAIIIISNSDKEIPFELARVGINFNLEKQLFVKEIIKEVLISLKKSGLCNNFQDYYNSLVAYLDVEKKKRKSIIDFLPTLPKDAQELRNFQKVRRKLTNRGYEQLELILYNEKEFSKKKQAAALKTAAKLKIEGFSKIALKFINSASESLINAGLNYLYFLYNLVFFQNLSKFLNKNSPLLNRLIVKLCRQQSPEYCKFLILHNLESKSPNIRELGLKMAAQFDFSLIHSELINFLRKEENDELLFICSLIIIANHDYEEFEEIKLLKRERPELKDFFEKQEIELRKSLQNLPTQARKQKKDAIAENSNKVNLEEYKILKTRDEVTWQSKRQSLLKTFLGVVIGVGLILFFLHQRERKKAFFQSKKYKIVEKSGNNKMEPDKNQSLNLIRFEHPTLGLRKERFETNPNILMDNKIGNYLDLKNIEKSHLEGNQPENHQKLLKNISEFLQY